jgi:hypothetical protein
MAADAARSVAKFMDVVAATEARATDVVAETTGMTDPDVGAQTDAMI